MTEPLFSLDSYLRQFDAAVVDMDPAERAVALDRTAFYPGGGGQPHDLGTLEIGGETFRVERVSRRDGRIWHGLDRLPERTEGTVRGSLDWDRRYALMRTHTALHILSAVAWRDFNVQVTGGNMSPLRGHLDFELETLTREMADRIEARLNEEVAAARDIRVRILPRDEANRIPDLIRTKVNLLPPGLTEIRTLEIEGLDLQADGGTHVGNTREVGPIRIAGYKSKGRMNKRIEIELGEAAT